MRQPDKRHGKYFFFLGIFILFLVIFVKANEEYRRSFLDSSSDELKVVFLDVGQGDAIYIEAPNGKQVIVDGGPGTVLVPALSPHMPFADDYIDMLIVTNPDKDHYEGFISLLDRYEVGLVAEPGTMQEDGTYRVFKDKINEKDVENVLFTDRNTIVLDQEAGVVLDVLFPDRSMKNWDRNDGSMVVLLTHKDNSFLLMGDSTEVTEGILRSNQSELISGVDVLKLGHHGSKTSTSEGFLAVARPTYGVVSFGKDNRYGHPHSVVLDRLEKYSVVPLFTTNGSVVFRSSSTGLTYSQ